MLHPDKRTANAQQSSLAAWFTPWRTAVQQLLPETLRPGQWAVSFLRAHAVVSFVGLVAWLGAGGSVVQGFFLPFFFLSVEIICPPWE